MNENEISKLIVHQAILIHKELGPGLLENAYKNCLRVSLMKEGLDVETEKRVPLIYKGEDVGCGFRADLIINEKVIIETKCVEQIADIHVAQILTYLKLSGLHLGLILNFNQALMKNGIRRVVNNLMS